MAKEAQAMRVDDVLSMWHQLGEKPPTPFELGALVHEYAFTHKGSIPGWVSQALEERLEQSLRRTIHGWVPKTTKEKSQIDEEQIQI